MSRYVAYSSSTMGRARHSCVN